ncbi:MAG: LysR family transcriptional regulator [Desulfuromonadaceae bacterium]|nr:LysR family transcriptional regulator [Desulfuromonadaceae bacterium]
MAITLRQLQIFEKVARCGNVTQASGELMLTQSAVSMAVAELERLAGGPLFTRQGKRLFLNDRGRQVLPRIREVLGQVRRIEQFLDDSAESPCGTLLVGASTTIGNYLLPALIGDFSQRYPQAKVLLHVANARQIEEGVDSGELDVGLTEGIPHSRTMQAVPWRRDRLVVIAGPDHPWAELGSATPRMLEEASWIMREAGSGTREIFEAAMNRKGLSCQIALELGHTEAIKKATEAGLGVACLSRMAVEREVASGWLVEIATPLELGRLLSVLMKKTETQTVLLRAFLNLLEQERDSTLPDQRPGNDS